MKEVSIPMFECLRCGHRWHPKKEAVPVCCGFCKSPYWNRPPDAESRVRERHAVECAACRAAAAAP